MFRRIREFSFQSSTTEFLRFLFLFWISNSIYWFYLFNLIEKGLFGWFLPKALEIWGWHDSLSFICKFNTCIWALFPFTRDMSVDYWFYRSYFTLLNSFSSWILMFSYSYFCLLLFWVSCYVHCRCLSWNDWKTDFISCWCTLHRSWNSLCTIWELDFSEGGASWDHLVISLRCIFYWFHMLHFVKVMCIENINMRHPGLFWIHEL